MAIALAAAPRDAQRSSTIALAAAPRDIDRPAITALAAAPRGVALFQLLEPMVALPTVSVSEAIAEVWHLRCVL